MVTVNDMLKRLEQVDIVDLTADAMEEHADQLTDLNREQMLDGVKSTGEQIGSYRPLSVFERSRLGRQTSHVDLYLTGEFQSKMFLKLTNDMYNFDSTDSKRDKLILQYGDAIFGLTSENKRKTWIEVQPIVVRFMKNIIGAI